MNINKSLLILAIAGMLFTGCKEASTEATAEIVKSDVAVKPETASFSISGMSCSVGCAKTIEKKLAGMDGVQKATVDFDTKSAVIEFDATKLTAEKLAEAVESAADGKTYKVADVKSSKDQAMVYNGDPAKKDKKKNKKKSCTSDDKTANDGKPACCASKKAGSV